MFLKKIFQGFLAVSMAVSGVSVAANDLVQVSALGVHEYRTFKKTASRDAALANAKEVALKKYLSSMPMAKQRMLMGDIDALTADIDTYIAEVQIQQEKREKSTKQYKVAIVARINPAALDVYLANNSAAGTQGSGYASDFGAMFIARVELSRKAFDVKRTTVSETNNLASLEETSASDGEKSIESVGEKSMSIKRTGGSSEQKRDSVEYEPSVDISEDVAYAVEEYLVNAGFEPMGVDQLDDVPLLDEIVDEMRESGRLPNRTRKMFQTAAIDAGWTFLGIGTIDIGVPQTDAARGTIRVPATVGFRVWSLDDGRARTAASVRPQVVYGQDRGNASVAQTNAYNEAVKYAMDTVVSQLQQKGLR
jgi:hypothetical protein